MPVIDWDAVHAEALDILIRYLQIDTSNPPGNEKPGARFLGGLIEAEGIACEYIETALNREVLVARLTGDGSKRPLMLGNHIDVVPVEADQWDVPAFEGVVRDGKIYGRGAVDMKGAAVMQLLAFLLVRRQRLPLKRDLVFCAVPDEEAAGRLGMEWLCEHRPDVVDVEYAINEGGGGRSEFAGREVRLFGVATNEKQICWLRLTAVGTPGHGSRPHEDNSAVHLMRALIRLADWDRGITYTPETSAFLDRLVGAGLIASRDSATVEAVIRASTELQATFMDTLNVTMLDSGIKANVIPARSEAVVDCRLLPGHDRDEWRRQVIDRIDDPRVEVTFHEQIDRHPPVAAEWDTELYHVVEAVVKESMEDAVVVPVTTTGATDSRFLRPLGVTAYGLMPCVLSPEELAGFHANNEFLTVDNLEMGCELMYEIVRRMCS